MQDDSSIEWFLESNYWRKKAEEHASKRCVDEVDNSGIWTNRFSSKAYKDDHRYTRHNEQMEGKDVLFDGIDTLQWWKGFSALKIPKAV